MSNKKESTRNVVVRTQKKEVSKPEKSNYVLSQYEEDIVGDTQIALFLSPVTGKMKKIDFLVSGLEELEEVELFISIREDQIQSNHLFTVKEGLNKFLCDIPVKESDFIRVFVKAFESFTIDSGTLSITIK